LSAAHRPILRQFDSPVHSERESTKSISVHHITCSLQYSLASGRTILVELSLTLYPRPCPCHDPFNDLSASAWHRRIIQDFRRTDSLRVHGASPLDCDGHVHEFVAPGAGIKKKKAVDALTIYTFCPTRYMITLFLHSSLKKRDREGLYLFDHLLKLQKTREKTITMLCLIIPL